VELKETHT